MGLRLWLWSAFGVAMATAGGIFADGNEEIMLLKLAACKEGAAHQRFGLFVESGRGTSIATVINGVRLCLDIESFGEAAGSHVYVTGWTFHVWVATTRSIVHFGPTCATRTHTRALLLAGSR
jgi:hypothetical protein